MTSPVWPVPGPRAAAVVALALALVAVPLGGMAGLPVPGGVVTPGAPLVALGLVAVAWGRPTLRLAPGVGAFLVGLGLYLAALAAAAVAAPDLGAAVLEAARWLELATAFLLAYAVAGTPGGREWAVTAALAAGTLEAAVGVGMAWRGVGPTAFAILGGHLARAFGHFGQPNPFGGYMNMVWPLGAALALGALGAPQLRRDQAVPPALALAGLGCAAVSGAGLVLSWSRGAWLAAAAAAAVMGA
ncbi:MAG: hypothetical protein ACE5EL_00895, partial [Anaerolineae bacterium]